MGDQHNNSNGKGVCGMLTRCTMIETASPSGTVVNSADIVQINNIIVAWEQSRVSYRIPTGYTNITISDTTISQIVSEHFYNTYEQATKNQNQKHTPPDEE